MLSMLVVGKGNLAIEVKNSLLVASRLNSLDIL